MNRKTFFAAARIAVLAVRPSFGVKMKSPHFRQADRIATRPESALIRLSCMLVLVLLALSPPNAIGQVAVECGGRWAFSPIPPQPVPFPPLRFDHAMAYDTEEHVTVLFGGVGNSSVFLRDTWEFDGVDWHLRSNNGPSPRAGHAMAFYSMFNQTFLFGGVFTDASCPSGCFYADTWAWNGGGWTRLSTPIALSARAYHAMVYDSVRRKIVLFGGRDQALKGDTWEFDFFSGGWTNVTPAAGPNPSPRFHHAMAYDIENQVTVLFGGDTGTGNSQSGETWTWDGTAWTQQFPASGPTARYGHKMAFDTAFHRIVLFGGKEIPGGSLKNDTWSWNGTTWIEDVHTPTPSVRLSHAMAYDSDRDQVVLFGGVATGPPVFDNWQWQSLGDDDAAPLDSQGKVILPPTLDPDEPIVDKDVDMDVGYVDELYPGLNTDLDTWYPKFPCEPDIGGTVPPEASSPDLQGELEREGITGVTPQDLVDQLKMWEDQIDAAVAQEVDPLPNSLPVTGPYPTPATPHCVPPACKYLFGGRDIVFVHGLITSHLKDKIRIPGFGDPRAQIPWDPATSFPGYIQNPEFYDEGSVMGYYKKKAVDYWTPHIQRFLTERGFKNRYLIVAWSTNDRLALGVQAVLTQIGDAMGPKHIGVVDPSGGDGTKFGTPSFVVISHSTGGPLTDVAMSAAARHPNLGAQFIPQHCKAHIGAQGAFGGSRIATATIAASGLIAIPPVKWLCQLARLGVSLFSNDPIPDCPIAFETTRHSVLVDLVPLVMQNKWGRYMDGGYIDTTPVRTLTVIGGHASRGSVFKFLLQPGFDDGVVTINSQVANPNTALLWPSSFVPGALALNDYIIPKLFDMGVAFKGNCQPGQNCEIGLDSPLRAIGYYIDQVVDRKLTPLAFFPGIFAAGGATPYVSPPGMVQPVGHEFALEGPPGLNPMRRYHNHYSFLQSASDHYLGTTEVPPSPDVYYADTHLSDRYEHNFEETRVLTDCRVYDPVPMTAGYANDDQPLLVKNNSLVSGCPQPPSSNQARVPRLIETVRGRTKTFKIRIFGKKYEKTWWIWKRRYHLLEGWRNKVQFDYVAESVLNHPPQYICPVDPGPDCNQNGISDECDIRNGTSKDCNHNGIPDECDIASGTSLDANHDGIPDECPDQPLNLATRGRVDTGDNVLIAGFIITGDAPKNVVVRGIGPSLAGFGITDALLDPVLELHGADGELIVSNDNWQDYPQGTQLTSIGLALRDPREAGIAATLEPGTSYTAVMAGKNGGTGVGLLEIYDTNSGADSQLANISTRGRVLTGNNVMIGGFILGGTNQNTRIVVRGIGPSLAQFGLNGLLADPTLELRDSNGALLISNDEWQDDPVQAAQLSARGLAPQDPRESGIFASLPAGAFTAILAGKDGGTGIGLVEMYNVP